VSETKFHKKKSVLFDRWFNAYRHPPNQLQPTVCFQCWHRYVYVLYDVVQYETALKTINPNIPSGDKCGSTSNGVGRFSLIALTMKLFQDWGIGYYTKRCYRKRKEINVNHHIAVQFSDVLSILERDVNNHLIISLSFLCIDYVFKTKTYRGAVTYERESL
jgi:hypothetical protein